MRAPEREGFIKGAFRLVSAGKVYHWTGILSRQLPICLGEGSLEVRSGRQRVEFSHIHHSRRRSPAHMEKGW
jgi:hypothetical protein